MEVDGDAHRPRLVGDGAGDGLADPPGGVGGELEALGVVELLDRPHQAEVALLDEVEELHAAADVALGDRHDQAKVGLDQFRLGPLAVSGRALEPSPWRGIEVVEPTDRRKLGQAHRRQRSSLDALGQPDLLRRGEQGDPADLLEVHAHRVGAAAPVAAVHATRLDQVELAPGAAGVLDRQVYPAERIRQNRVGPLDGQHLGVDVGIGICSVDTVQVIKIASVEVVGDERATTRLRSGISSSGNRGRHRLDQFIGLAQIYLLVQSDPVVGQLGADPDEVGIEPVRVEVQDLEHLFLCDRPLLPTPQQQVGPGCRRGSG